MARKQGRMAASAGTDFQNPFARQVGKRHFHHRHVLAQAEHVFQRIKGLQQLIARNVLIRLAVKRIIQRPPERLDIVLVIRQSHARG